MLLINRNVDLKSGIEWIKASFKIFREKPLQFIVLSVCDSLISLAPGVGPFLSPLFTARFATLASKIERNEEVLFSALFEGFFANKRVIRLGVINACFSMIIIALQYAAENFLTQTGGATGNDVDSLIGLLLLLPIMLLVISTWLSPLICLYNPNVPPLQAMLLSIKACGFNVVTLLLYSLIVLVFSIAALIPFGLGLLIWLPILNITTYFIYKSVFIPQQRM